MYSGDPRHHQQRKRPSGPASTPIELAAMVGQALREEAVDLTGLRDLREQLGGGVCGPPRFPSQHVQVGPVIEADEANVEQPRQLLSDPGLQRESAAQHLLLGPVAHPRVDDVVELGHAAS